MAIIVVAEVAITYNEGGKTRNIRQALYPSIHNEHTQTRIKPVDSFDLLLAIYYVFSFLAEQ